MPYIPPTGLIGSEQALRQGLQGQLGAINQGVGGATNALATGYGIARDDLNQGYGQAAGVMNPFVTGGAEASQLQAAQSGALGPEAQAQAYQNYQQSPGQQWALDQGRQQLLAGASATGGVGGGNARRALMDYGVGRAQQNFQQDFNNLGQVGASGQAAAGTQANIYGQQGANLANTAMSTGQNMANLGLQGGMASAGAIGSTGNNLAQGRFATGQQIAQAAGNTAANMSNLQNQQGQQLAGVFGQGSTNLANTVSGAGQGSSQMQQQLATILANIGTGAGSSVAQTQANAAQYDAAGIMGQSQAVQSTLGPLLQMASLAINYQDPNKGGTNFNQGSGRITQPTQSGRPAAPIF
jgi:hypothetical protein